jgi:hypothetical protein
MNDDPPSESFLLITELIIGGLGFINACIVMPVVPVVLLALIGLVFDVFA